MSQDLQSFMTGVADSMLNGEAMSPIMAGAVKGTRFSAESMQPEERKQHTTTMQNLQTLTKRLAVEQYGRDDYQIEGVARSAALGYLSGKDPKAFIDRKVTLEGNLQDVTVVGSMGLESRKVAMENYDNRDTHNAPVLTAGYNMAAPLQSAAAEMLFPTVVISPEQTGWMFEINRVVLQNKLRRGISGKPSDWGETPLIRALRNPDLLRNDLLAVKPVYRDDSKEFFVSDTVALPTETMSNGEAILTSYLATRKEVDLIAVSSTTAMAGAGLPNETDSLDTYGVMKHLLVKIGEDCIDLNVGMMFGSAYNYAVQGDSRKMVLNLELDNIPVNKDLKAIGDKALVTLAAIKTNEWTVYLGLSANGSLNLRTSQSVVYGNAVVVKHIVDKDGNLVPTTTGSGKTLADLVASAEVIGYKVDTKRSNLNLRLNGQMVAHRQARELVPVGLGSPLMARRAISDDGSNTFADVQDLINQTHIAIEAAAMRAIRDTADSLRSYAKMPDPSGVGPSVLGCGRYYVNPYFLEDEIDVAAEIDSLTSGARRDDIRGLLTTRITDMVNRMFVNGEYKSMLTWMYGASHPKPCVGIVTTPRVESYLMISGDPRTLGTGYDVRCETTINNKYDDEIFFTFIVNGDERNTKPNLANFGTFFWAPEVVTTINIPRDGQMSTEVVVTPRFQYSVNLPIMGYIKVKNLLDSLKSISLNVINTPTP